MSNPWQINFHAINSPSTPSFSIPRFKEFTFYKPMSDVGAATLVTDAGAITDATLALLEANTYMMQFLKAGVCKYIAWVDNIEEEWVVDSGTNTITISGAGYMDYLRWLVVLPTGWDPLGPYDIVTDWSWTAQPPMKMFRDLLNAAATRWTAISAGTMPNLGSIFGTANDSGSVAWANTFDFTQAPGPNLLDMLGKFSEMAGVDWYFDPSTLDLLSYQTWPAGNAKGNFFVGHDQKQNKRTITRRDLVTSLASRNATKTDSQRWGAGMTAHGVREAWVEFANTTGLLPLQAATGRLLAGLRSQTDSFSFNVVPDTPGREVFIDYDVGELVNIETPRLPMASYQLRGIGVKVDENGFEEITELTVASSTQLAMRKLQRQIDREIGNGVNSNLPQGLGASGSGGGVTQVTLSSVALGSSGGSSSFTWYTVTGVFARGIITRFVVSNAGGSTDWDLEVRSADAGGGSLKLQVLAVGATSYDISWPWQFQNDAALAEMYVGIKNRGASTAFTLTTLVGEKFA